MAFKRKNDNTPSTWVNQGTDDMSAPLKAKWDAWRKAVDAERAAKKTLDNAGGVLARKAEIIKKDQFVCYGMGRGGSSGFFVNDVEADKGGAATVKKPGVKF